MSDRPILFSALMVRALLAGRKTQTRRVLKLHNMAIGDEQPSPVKPPIGLGERLWVREAIALVGTTDPGFVLYRADGYENECRRHGFDRPYPPESSVRWRPSIHMPRCASRLTLTVTGVKVERLQEISEGDAEAEGVPACARRVVGFESGCSSFVCGYQQLWQEIHRPKQKPGVYTPEWKGPGSWASDPWVACYTFTVEQRNIDA